jgi:hypothetical protein
VLAAEHLLDFPCLHLLLERVEPGCDLGVDRLAGFRPFQQYGEILAAAAERCRELTILLETAAALENLLGFGRILPEIWCGGAGFEAGQFIVRPGRFKDSSGDRPRAW